MMTSFHDVLNGFPEQDQDLTTDESDMIRQFLYSQERAWMSLSLLLSRSSPPVRSVAGMNGLRAGGGYRSVCIGKANCAVFSL